MQGSTLYQCLSNATIAKLLKINPWESVGDPDGPAFSPAVGWMALCIVIITVFNMKAGMSDVIPKLSKVKQHSL